MSTAPVYSNHAGTLSDSFAIGKRGVKILQGSSSPAGVSAPTGSLYVVNNTSGVRVYQIDSLGNWTVLLSPTDIVEGAGISISTTDGVVTVTHVPNKFKQSFTSANLSAGVLTVNHNLGEDFPVVQIYNNSRQVVTPDGITSVSASQTTVDLTSYGAISGTWQITISAE